MRYALIIACSDYDARTGFCKLPWAKNDAVSMNVFLKSIGFKIEEAIDTDLIDIKKKYEVLLELVRS
jgi:hypothetical protein